MPQSVWGRPSSPVVVASRPPGFIFQKRERDPGSPANRRPLVVGLLPHPRFVGLGDLSEMPRPGVLAWRSGQSFQNQNQARSHDGREGDRTLDLGLARAALSRLSYPPDYISSNS